MASLKDTIVQGSLRVTDTTYTDKIFANNGITAYTTDGSAFNTQGLLFSKTDGTILGRIGVGLSKNNMGIYAGENIILRPQSGTSASSADGVIITSDGLLPTVTNTENLGSSDLKWANLYATTLNGALAASNITGTLGVEHGGTGATTAAAARTNLLAATGNGRIFYGTCDTAAATVPKVITCPEYDSLQEGDIVIVKFTTTNSKAVGSITMNVNNTGTLAVKKLYNAALNNLTAVGEINANVLGVFMYSMSGTTGYWVMINADYNNTYDNAALYSAAGANRTAETAANGGIGLHRYSLEMMTINQTWSSIASAGTTAIANTTANDKSAATAAFLIDSPILYQDTNTQCAPGGSVSVNGYTALGINLSYSTGTTSNAAGSLTIQKPVYLVGTLNDAKTFKLDTTKWWTQSLPATDTNNEKIYIYLGLAYSATNIYLSPVHPIYKYKDGTLQLLNIPSISYTGTAPASFATKILGTTDATASTGALIIDGGLLIKKKTYLTGALLSSTTNYGPTLPSGGTTGQIFFQTSDVAYELPSGGAAGTLLVKNTAADRDVIWSNTVSSLTATGNITAAKVFNAVWNDYAECRQSDITEPGRVIVEKGNGEMILATERLMPGCKIISDTYGTLMGESQRAKTPVAVAGRVLAYPYQDKSAYKVGDAVCSAPNGTVDIMTREEIREYPERILGTVSEVPDYGEWHAGTAENPIHIPVDGRIWIYVR